MFSKYTYFIAALLAAFTLSACESFLDVGAPTTSINSENVFADDATAISAVTTSYTEISGYGISTNLMGVGMYTSLSADELRIYAGDDNEGRLAIYKNEQTTRVNQGFWSSFYTMLYRINACIEGLNASTVLTPQIKQQLLGESYFTRALFYFYLTALYGDVPLVVTTDYVKNAAMGRTAKDKVYDQILADLLQAKSLMSDQYLDGTILASTTERLRPTKAAASALLARFYLYRGDWEDAEQEASNVISNANYGFVTPIEDTFLKNSRETIWALQPIGGSTSSSQNAPDGLHYIPYPETTVFGWNYPVYLSDDFRDSFEDGDNRKTAWISSVDAGAAGIQYFAFKYKIPARVTPTVEYGIVLRISEQYLIRAEARARQNKLTGAGSAQSDLNAVRNRSGLGDTPASSETELLDAIARERKVELFTEWGDRWFNMQRNGTIDDIMEVVTAAKGGTWEPYKRLFPIPLDVLMYNPALEQNDGYLY